MSISRESIISEGDSQIEKHFVSCVYTRGSVSLLIQLLVAKYKKYLQCLWSYGYHSVEISLISMMLTGEEPSNWHSSSTTLASPNNAERKLDLIWSLRPIWILMKFMGNNLDLSVKLTAIWCYWNWLFGILMLSITFLYSGFIIVEWIENVNTFSANTKAWNNAIITFQEIFAGVSIHLSTFVITNWYWKPLWKCIRQLDRLMTFQDDHYRRLRKFSILVLLEIMLVSNNFFSDIVQKLDYFNAWI